MFSAVCCSLPQFCVRTPGRSPGEPSTSCPGGWPATAVVGGNASAAESGGRRGQPARICRLELEGVGARAGALRWFGIGRNPSFWELGKPNKPVDVQSVQRGRATLENKEGRPRHRRNLERREGGRFSTLATFVEPPPPAEGPAGSPTIEKLEKGFSPDGFQRFQRTLSPPTGSQTEV